MVRASAVLLADHEFSPIHTVDYNLSGILNSFYRTINPQPAVVRYISSKIVLILIKIYRTAICL